MSAIYEALRPYQRKAAGWGARAGSFLLADQPGLGKTIETLGTVVADKAYHRPGGPKEWHLIVCPSVAVNNVWAPEVTRWLTDTKVEVLSLTGPIAARRKAFQEFRTQPDTEHVFVITNIEALRIEPIENPKTGKKNLFLKKAQPLRAVPGALSKDKTFMRVSFRTAGPVLPALFSVKWNTIVVDESHRALIRKTGTPTQTRAGFTMLTSDRRIALSGTPMRGKPEQLWGTLNWLQPRVYTSYWKWVEKYFMLSSNGFSDYVLGEFQEGGEDRMARDLTSIMLRRTKSEVLPDLPPKTYAGSWLLPEAHEDGRSPLLGIWLDPSAKQLKQIAQFTDEGIVLDGSDNELIANGVLAQYTRARQLAGAYHLINGEKLTPTLDSPKYEWLKDFIEELDGERVVVASQFTSIIDVFAEGLRAEGVDCHVLTGKTSDKQRTRIISDFQSDTPSATVFLLNTTAGGVAVTLDKSDFLVLLDETTIPDDQEQVEDRIHRASRMHNVTIYYLRTRNTIEEEVAYISAARENVQKYLLDGARGIAFAKQVYAESKGQK